MFCNYKDIFGKLRKGIHQYRIFDIAILDVVGTIVLGYILHMLNQKFNIVKKISFTHILILLFILSIVLHRLFCVRTTIDKLLFI